MFLHCNFQQIDNTGLNKTNKQLKLRFFNRRICPRKLSDLAQFYPRKSPKLKVLIPLRPGARALMW